MTRLSYREDVEKEMSISRDYEMMIKFQMCIRNVIDQIICIKDMVADDEVYDGSRFIALITNESDHIASINILDTTTYNVVARGCSVTITKKLTNEKIRKDTVDLLLTQLCMQ